MPAQYLFDLDEFDLTGEFKECPDAPAAPALTLADGRPYQYEWRDRVRLGWAAGRSRLVGVAATGTGKSFGAALIVNDVLTGLLDPLGRGRQAVVISHRGLLVKQLRAELSVLLPGRRIDVEMGGMIASAGADVVVACLDSLCQPRRLRYFPPARFAACVWDESHRYGKNDVRVRRVLHHFGDECRHIGLTATPDRSDRLSAFEDVAFEFDIYTAVEEGYLVRPYVAYEFSGDIQLDRVPLTAGGEFDPGGLADLMSGARPIAAVVSAARKWSNYNGGARQTVVTCASVRHAELAALALNEWHRQAGGGTAVAIHSGLDEGTFDANLAAFRRGAARYACHFDCLTEGFDSDLPKVYINGRPMKSRWVFGQGAGRTLRPDRKVARLLGREPDAAVRRDMIAKSPKPGAMIVDVAGTGHRLSVDMHDVFRPGGWDDTLVLAARKRSLDRAEGGRATDLMAEYAALKRLRDDARRADDEAAWKGVLVSAPLLTRMEDPFERAARPGREPPWVTGKKPTKKMRDALLKFGVPRTTADGYTFSQAQRVMDVIIARLNSGLASYNQVNLLRKYDVDAVDWTFEDASAEIDRIAKAGWRRVPPAAAGGEE